MKHSKLYWMIYNRCRNKHGKYARYAMRAIVKKRGIK